MMTLALALLVLFASSVAAFLFFSLTLPWLFAALDRYQDWVEQSLRRTRPIVPEGGLGVADASVAGWGIDAHVRVIEQAEARRKAGR